MQATEHGPEWFATQRFVEQVDLEHTCGLSAAEIDELVEYGALVPLLAPEADARRFNADCLEPLRQAARLRQLYDLDLFAVGLVLGYLTRIDRLEERIRALQAHLPHGTHVEREGPAPWHEPHG
jgi:chaperone modulatory protein CbpM